MNRKLLSLLLASLAIFLAGCSTLTSEVKPGVSLANISSVYVVKLEGETENIDNILCVELRKIGIKATTGPESAMPSNVDAYMTYYDKWFWDMTPYLLQLDVKLHNPKSKQIIATGRSYRPSMVRKSPVYMAQEVIAKMFSKPVPQS